MSELTPEMKRELDSFLETVSEFRVILIQLFDDYMIQGEEAPVNLPPAEPVKRPAEEITPIPKPAEDAESDDDFYCPVC